MQPLDDLGHQIDVASAARDEKSLLELAEECKSHLQTAQGSERVYLLYYHANVFGSIVGIRQQDPKYEWSWDQSEGIENILLLRRAIAEPSFSEINLDLACQIGTNLAIRLHAIGRPIAANEAYLRVLDRNPKFAKALVGRARVFESYAKRSYDDGHKPILLSTARMLLDDALDESAHWESGDRKDFETSLIKERDWIVKMLKKNGYDETNYNFDEWDLGDTEDEVEYRCWCLRERLFLNPLNDAFERNIAATDVLHLPSHAYRKDEWPRFPMYFNVIKQEYVSARYRLYRAINRHGPDYVTRDVLLLDSGEGQELGHHTEELKAALRSAYSIFDKIGLFLNDYFDLGKSPNSVNFRNVWLENPNRHDSGIRPEFEDLQNWLLRGLYFLSKDLFDDKFQDVAEPDAFELSKLRNQVEHRFLIFQETETYPSTDTHRFISIEEFEAKAMRVLRMAREALIYLSLAMHREEQRREQRNLGSMPIRGVVASQRIIANKRT